MVLLQLQAEAAEVDAELAVADEVACPLSLMKMFWRAWLLLRLESRLPLRQMPGRHKHFTSGTKISTSMANRFRFCTSLRARLTATAMVYFRRSDVVSAGDIFMTTTYPIIDVNNGGSINGVINGLNHLLDLTIPKEKQEGGTMVIPGHGRISDEADVVEYRDMVTIIRDRIRDAIKKGKTLQQVQSSGLTKDYDPRYGTNTGPWTTAMFIEAAYQSLSRKP